ncbi:MAG TPA: efflux RND transporter periplasmic adaptor subunit [Nitrospirae bacterium]|nr:multidrug resistance protein MdtA precursor [bacterium BMS3Abin06]HDH12066.1 efflux RND transporter periplasmic adaptor subunit [Nitrospirota bacterium]HDZ02247.1 efflux RND transporter periplasmic adaptor subunit [Nitrospirota bacterium]
MSRKTKLLKIAIPLIIIFAGFGIMKVLIAERPAPVKEIKENPGVLVEVFRADRENRQIIVKGTGTAKAAQEISVIPQVSGRVTYTAPGLVVGGFFKKDEILFEIEGIDYILALERAKAARANAEYELATIESRARIAREEWERINKDEQVRPNPLVLYGPQLKNAQAALASADAALEQARLNLERTQIRAPFNGRVQSENIDIGQYVIRGSSVAFLSGTDTTEINVPLTADDLSWLHIPAQGEKERGPQAVVSVSVGGETYQWEGRVTRSTGEVDPKSRMMQLIVEINDPYGLKEKKDPARPALAAGTFVDVQIKGRMLKDVFVVPRTALRDNSTVWVMDSEKKLRIKKVAPLRMEKDEAIIADGIEDGDMIIRTNISGAANGMKLRPVE